MAPPFIKNFGFMPPGGMPLVNAGLQAGTSVFTTAPGTGNPGGTPPHANPAIANPTPLQALPAGWNQQGFRSSFPTAPSARAPHSLGQALAATQVPAGFQEIFSSLPEGITVSSDVVRIYHHAYQLIQPEARLDVADISRGMRALAGRMRYVEGKYGFNLAEEPLIYLCLGLLINGNKKEAYRLCYELDTLAFEQERIRALIDVEDLSGQIQVETTLLQMKTDQLVRTQGQIAELVNQNTGFWTHESRDLSGDVFGQVRELEDQAWTLGEEIKAARVRVADLETKQLQAQRRAVKNQYNVLANTGAPRDVRDRFLASLSLNPELIPDEAFAKKVEAARARVSKSAQDGSIEEVIYTDPGKAVQRAVDAYNQRAVLLDIVASFETIERYYLDGSSDNYYHVEEEFGVKEADLPDPVRNRLYETDKEIPILVQDDGKHTSNWVLVSRQADGAITIKPFPVSWEGIDPDNLLANAPTFKPGSFFLVSPLTLPKDQLEQWKTEQVGHKATLAGVLASNPAFEKLRKIGSELSTHMEPLQALMAQGPTAYTKDQDFLSVLQGQAQGVIDFYFANYEEINSSVEAAEEVLRSLQTLETGALPDDFEKALKKEIAQLKAVQEMVRSESVVRLADALLALEADFDAQKIDYFLKTDGLVLVSAVAGGVLAMTGVGLVFGTAIFAGIGGMAIAAGAMGLGSVPGQELGLYASGELFDTGLQSHWQQYQSGRISKDELTQTYMKMWATSAATTFAFMGAGRIAGHFAGRMALSPNAATASTGQTILQMGRFIDKTLHKFFQPRTRIGQFFHELVGENAEELFEQAAQEINPALGTFATMLNCLDGRNIEVQLSPAQVTIAGQTLVGNQLAMNFHYSAGRQNVLLAKVKELYEGAKITEVAPYTYQVEIEYDGGKKITQVFSPSQDPYALRRAATNQIHDNYDGNISYNSYLSDVVGLTHERGGSEYRVTPDTDIAFLEQQLKGLGMVVYQRNTDAADPYLMVFMGPTAVKVYTDPTVAQQPQASIQDSSADVSSASATGNTTITSTTHETKAEAREAAFRRTEQTGAEHSYLYDSGKYVVLRGSTPNRAPTGIFGDVASSAEREFFGVKLGGHIHPKDATILPSKEDLQLAAAEAANRKENVEFEVGGWLPNGSKAVITIVATYSDGQVFLRLSDPENVLWRNYPRALQQVRADISAIEHSTNASLRGGREGELLVQAYQEAAARDQNTESTTQTVLDSHDKLLETTRSFNGAVLFIGHGSKGQFGDLEAVHRELDQTVEQLNQTHGEGKWVAIFGGDNFNPDKPDIAHVMKYLSERHNVPIMAVQSDVVVDWGGVDSYVNYVRYIPTFYVEQEGAGGKPEQKVHWGGMVDEVPQGPTGVYLGDDFVGGKSPILSRVVAIGGGPIGLDEAKYAYGHGIPVEYIRAETKNHSVNGKYGSVDAWAEGVQAEYGAEGTAHVTLDPEKTKVEKSFAGLLNTDPVAREKSEEPDALLEKIRESGKTPIVFVGSSGSGYEDVAAMKQEVGDLLNGLDPDQYVVVTPANTGGIGDVSEIAKSLNFEVFAIDGKRSAKYGISPHIDHFTMFGHKRGMESQYTVAAALQGFMVVIGGKGQAESEGRQTLASDGRVIAFQGVRNREGELGASDTLIGEGSSDPNLTAVATGTQAADAIRRNSRQNGGLDPRQVRLEGLLHSEDFATLVARDFEAAYQDVDPSVVEFDISPTNTQIHEGVARNLVGFYALEAGIGLISEQTGKPPRQILVEIQNGTLPEGDLLLLARFGFATYKAGQFFIDPRNIQRGNFVPVFRQSRGDLDQDLVQIRAAAALLLPRIPEGDLDTQRAALKDALQDRDFAVEMAKHLDAAYRQHAGIPPKELDTGVTEKPVYDAVARNLAGFYAVEGGAAALAERTGRTPEAILQGAANGTLPDTDMLFLARFANATWKASQPFRGMDRIARDNFIPAVALSEAELRKDFDQISAAAKVLSDRINGRAERVDSEGGD